MPKKRLLQPQSVWERVALAAAFEEHHIKPSHIAKLYRYLLRHGAEARWQDVPNLPQAAVALLERDFARTTSRLVHAQHSASGDTIKLLVQLQDGLQVESVVMTYDTTDSGKQTGQVRATLCVSSEVGCQMGCTFCATGTMGLTADLTAGEIVEQLVHAISIMPVRNVVFMGMGEPLNNYVAVREAVSLMTDNSVFALRRSAVSVSTVGVIPRLAQLATDLPGVSLALSLHAPTQELRQRIVPSAKAYKLDRLMAAVAAYQATTQQRVFIEYVMLGPAVNCTEEHAHQLGQLLQGRDVVVNLIPWNPILSPGMEFEAPVGDSLARFHSILREQYGLPCTVRQEKGQDISGACGQLVLERGGGCKQGSLADVEDLGAAAARAAAAR
ncbi:hypothetical protein N2152v2_001866 [Parachlorella kessleri]